MYRVDKKSLEIATVNVTKFARGYVTFDVNAGTFWTTIRVRVEDDRQKFFNEEDDAKAYVRAHGLDRVEAITLEIDSLEIERGNIKSLLGLT